ncbi:nucleoside diphosphate kinase regulator [Asticcacaulis sp. BYS171W]|uniref:Nucleoside diphosphate kinase regulator n=1 Tax=Asticcacaulis aquaticus TaxID=2984212 RepID=A0ABT5HZ00_9CAUL|nr:nucleoside diphosphate kinase regulator [Asticcacaulis aquaticus]MDC7685147.1 nucleoside diphosphate kinase regulator [Asticcacaulis aquaticus]
MTAQKTRLPAIQIGDDDFRALEALTGSVSGPLAAAAERLLTELERARRKPQHQIPATVVSMGDRITFDRNGVETTGTLVLPHEADISAGRLSVLTPVGAALIGLSLGQSIAYRTPGGDSHTLTVQAIDRS